MLSKFHWVEHHALFNWSPWNRILNGFFIFLYSVKWFSTQGDCAMKREIWQCLERFGVVRTGAGDAPGFLWVEAGDVGKCPGMHGWSHLKEWSSPQCQSCHGWEVLCWVISLACGLGLGNRERVKCQVQSHKIGASARDMRMLPFPGGGGESSWHIRPSVFVFLFLALCFGAAGWQHLCGLIQVLLTGLWRGCRRLPFYLLLYQSPEPRSS